LYATVTVLLRAVISHVGENGLGEQWRAIWVHASDQLLGDDYVRILACYSFEVVDGGTGLTKDGLWHEWKQSVAWSVI